MFRFDFTNDELSATIEAKVKNEKVQVNIETVQLVKMNLEKMLMNRFEIKNEVILFAFQGYEEYLTKPDLEYIKSIIPTIEKNIRNDIKLKPKCNESIKDGIWVLYSYYALFFISVMNKRYYAAVRYSFKTFLVDPPIARTQLFPYIFYKYFEPKFFNEYKELLKCFPQDPRTYAKGLPSHIMMENYIKLFINKSDGLEEYIDKQCYYIAKESLNNFYVYSIIKSLLIK